MQITDRVHVVGRCDWGGLSRLSAGGSANVFLLDGRSELALIDTGMPEGVDDVLANIRQADFDPARITKILLTHAHWDHTAGTAGFLNRLSAARVHGHALTKATLAGEPGIYLPAYHPPQFPAPVHVVIDEGANVTVGDLPLRVLHVPGHTPDGLAFVFDQSDGAHAFTGDTAIGDQPTGDGCVGWFEWVWKSNLAHYLDSIQRLLDLNLSNFYTGHGNAQLAQAPVRKALTGCLARLNQLKAIPALGTMMPEMLA